MENKVWIRAIFYTVYVPGIPHHHPCKEWPQLWPVENLKCPVFLLEIITISNVENLK